ncbi:PAAR domain-containing protein [Stenotrophomonas sp.]|uniref:PAAR domain-containing protein n=1 Tax=Stenotrophomonas sp. TaxID=69392 RepID=UPI0019A1DB96|nr:PAAR domain-containing protein [Stenotrophomonas sp.]MBD3828112.1 PAAR domain-containing protein [Stenotrophomonas sp.]
MRRYWIVVGDTTSSCGRVITGSPFTDIEGAAVARVGDRATCPLHGGGFAIVGGDVTLRVDGQPVALDGDLLACGCHLRSTVQRRVYVDETPTRAVEVGSGPAQAHAAATPVAPGAPQVCQACLVDAARSGTPMVRLP